MAHYERSDGSAAFDIADRFTVREQLAYRSRIAEAIGQPMLLRLWAGALTVMTNWKSVPVPDAATFDMDASGDAAAADAIQWAANTAANHMAALEMPDPNS